MVGDGAGEGGRGSPTLVIAYSISCTYTPEKYLRNYLFRRLQLSLVTNNALVHTIDLTINTPSLSYKSIVSQSLISLHNSYYNTVSIPCHAPCSIKFHCHLLWTNIFLSDHGNTRRSDHFLPNRSFQHRIQERKHYSSIVVYSGTLRCTLIDAAELHVIMISIVIGLYRPPYLFWFTMWQCRTTQLGNDFVYKDTLMT